MTWIELNTAEQLNTIKEQSKNQPIIIFKHSTRCSISAMAERRMEQIADAGTGLYYHLDLIKHRDISNQIATNFQVHHESPQTLLIVNGECVYEESHNGITAQEIETEVNEWNNKMNNSVAAN